MEIKDTSEAAERILINGYRSMLPWRKMQQVVALTQAVQRMALSRIRKQYGIGNENDDRLRMAALWLPREIMLRLFGWDPVKKGY